MPVRARAHEELVKGLYGQYTINTRDETIRFAGEQPEPLTERFDTAERAYIRMIDSIDWNRVVLEATSRHMALHPERDEKEGIESLDPVRGVCPECLCEALLRKDWTPWDEQPMADRTVP